MIALMHYIKKRLCVAGLVVQAPKGCSYYLLFWYKIPVKMRDLVADFRGKSKKC
jgi:hypothetical protein